MIAPARRAAVDALAQIDETDIDMGAAIAGVRATLHDERDGALLLELVSGTLRMRAAIDYQLALRVTRPLARLDAAVLRILRISAFQLIYQSRLPPSAVINDAVELTRRAGKSSAAGFTNGVLRALSRERKQLQWPASGDPDQLAIVHSHPRWLVDRWVARYGVGDTTTWLAFNNQPAAMCLAANRHLVTREALADELLSDGVTTQPTGRATGGLEVTEGRALNTRAFREGRCIVQDEASQLIGELASEFARGRILDLCASPGGKTLALSATVRAGGTVVASDVRANRIRLLSRTLARCRVPNAQVVHLSDGPLPFRDETFDLVLIDAPCSGLGTVRRDPDIRWRRSPEDLPRFAAAQRELLSNAARVVKRGGTLVYSTCSSEPEENAEVIAAFLASAPGFTETRRHETLPFRDQLEAFFGAVLERTLGTIDRLSTPLGTRVWSFGKILLLAGALAITFFVFAGIAMRVAVRARQVTVPDFVGKPVADATTMAAALDLPLRVDEARRPDAKVQVGYILDQDPKPGSTVRRQRSVRVWVSAGAHIARAPSLLGETQRSAEIRVAQEGLLIGTVSEIRSAQYAPDVIVAQDPPATTQTAEVRLLVNRGEDRATYVMPDLIGLSGDRAADVMRVRGFRVSITAQSAASAIPPGVIVRQTPAGGYQVHPGDAIALEVSR